MALHVETKREYGPFHFPESHKRTSDKLVALLEACDAVRMKQRRMLPPAERAGRAGAHHIDALAQLGMFLREARTVWRKRVPSAHERWASA